MLSSVDSTDSIQCYSDDITESILCYLLWLLGYLVGRLFVPGGRALSISLKVETLGAEMTS